MKDKNYVGQWQPEMGEAYWYTVSDEIGEGFHPNKERWSYNTIHIWNRNSTPLFKTENECQEYIDSLNQIGESDIDNVNHPPHYTSTKVEVIDTLQGSLSEDEYLGFLKGNVIKYVLRAGKKQNTIEDLNKAIWYINKIKEKDTQ